MKKEVGLWVDHQKTVIVTIEDELEKVREIRSNVEKHVLFSSDTSAKSSFAVKGPTAENKRDRQFDEHLGRYYEAIISLIGDADSIWIFGPGEAKVELENQLRHKLLGARVEGIETVDKMTDHQIAAKVRDHFQR